MTKRFSEIDFPPSYRYRSDGEHVPIDFYDSTFPIAQEIDLLLGYFSSNAFKVLSCCFAEFIFNGGKMRLITNHIFSLKDFENLIDNVNVGKEDIVIDIMSDINKFESTLSDYGQHFFDCLKYLMRNGRLEILPVKFNETELSHSKVMILSDGNDRILADGSINFTLKGLIKNAESFSVETPWNGEISQNRIEEEQKNFNRIFSKEHPDYKYLDKEEIELFISSVGRDKETEDLLEDSVNLEMSQFSEKVRKTLENRKEEFNRKFNPEEVEVQIGPRFPFDSGPREYQIEAYEEWVKNNRQGVFAMATGTGKTITSLNCLLNEYVETKSYRAIILVPSIALLNQWEEEVVAFGFVEVTKVGGGNKWEPDIASYVSNSLWGTQKDLIIISTYGSFTTDRFQKYFVKIQSDFMLIADEAHNMGAKNVRIKLPDITCPKRIGLSATPKRIYDLEGTIALDEFFNDEPPYTYEFGIERALIEGHLCEYKYHPVLVELNEAELEEYSEITRKLVRYFDAETASFRNEPIVEILLLKRKNIIHKAINKIEAFKGVLQEIESLDITKYIFTYIPEGYVISEDGSERMLNQFIRACSSTLPELKINSYTAEDEDLKGILRGFSEGRIDMLFAMKMLDEGVDIPRAEVGVFCSSTGNPRQFIQRRGRLLRNHRDKSHATIFDMVVIPRALDNSVDNFNLEQSLIKKELQRVGYFASLSMNFYDSKNVLEEVCRKYELSLDQIISEL
jgi:superfamily II DNA or RNA helicase